MKKLTFIAIIADAMDKMRLDKWLWAARFYKTRSLAMQEVGKGRVLVNDQLVKPAREIAPGDVISVRKEGTATLVRVSALSAVRGPAPVARQLYAETPESVAAREHAAELRRLAPEPAQDIKAGRPTKRDRRRMDSMRGK
jgi:ribosome-associated heat shock protein Hsp15